MSLTTAQKEMVGTLDDVAEHVAWEFEYDESEASVVGFAKISNIRGTGSFVRRVQSLAKSEDVDWIRKKEEGEYYIEIGSLELSLGKSYDGGYELSVSNVRDFVSGTAYQRLDVRKKLNSLSYRDCEVTDTCQMHV